MNSLQRATDRVHNAIRQPGTPEQYRPHAELVRNGTFNNGEEFGIIDTESVPGFDELYLEWFRGRHVLVVEPTGGAGRMEHFGDDLNAAVDRLIELADSGDH